MNDQGTPHTEIDLHDGTVKCYERTGNSLFVFISAWNESELKIVFHGVLSILDTFSTNSDLQELREYPNACTLPSSSQHQLRLLVELMCCSQSDLDEARHFRFLSTDNVPVLDVFCKSMQYDRE